MAMRSVGLPTIWNPLDPVGSFVDMLRSAYEWLENWVTGFLAKPPRFSDRGILPDLYTIGTANAQYIAYLAALLIIIVGVALMRGTPIVRALVAWVAVSILSPLWVQVINNMANTGNSVTAGMNFYTPPDVPDFPIDDPIIGTLLFLLNIVFTFVLSVEVGGYELVIIFVKFWGMIVFALWALGKRTRQLGEVIIALTIVATLIGRPVAQFIMETGQVLRYTFPGGNTLVLGGTIIMFTTLFAIISQVVLVIACYRAVQAIEGRIKSLVKGTVVSTVMNTVKVDLNKLRKQGPQPIPTYSVAPPAPTAKDHVHRAGRAAARKASTTVGAAATAAGHPAIGLAVSKGGNHAFRENKPRKR